MADLDVILRDDGQGRVVGVTRQPVEHRKDTPRRGVLDRQHQPIDIASLECGERLGEAVEAYPFVVRKQLTGNPVAVGMGLALVADPHGARVDLRRRAADPTGALSPKCDLDAMHPATLVGWAISCPYTRRP